MILILPFISVLILKIFNYYMLKKIKYSFKISIRSDFQLFYSGILMVSLYSFIFLDLTINFKLMSSFT
ncbi:hypothetical protein C3495_00670 [Clostridiaceae bacterium 14S0207]|nr:hypothetical protein C3495_00670 [Clostridiaceae bacterium 14S0207]